jgi:hypothetical protein
MDYERESFVRRVLRKKRGTAGANVRFPCIAHRMTTLAQEIAMSLRMATASALALAFASPAFADCNQELAMLEQKVVSMETGAATGKSGIPATKHQEEVMPGKQQGGDPEITGSTAGKVESTSPHQEQVTGKRSAQSAENASQLMAEARKRSEAGDEQGCLKKLAELKDMLGAN